jgi:hypothetical protein
MARQGSPASPKAARSRPDDGGFAAVVSSPCIVGAVEPEESPKQRHDRELIELLNELRVALPGVQVLFAFLLAVPFARGWTTVTPYERDVFFVAFIAAAISSALLIATSAIHRIGWRVADKEKIVRVGTWLTIGGLTALAVAIVASVLVVTDYIFGRTAGVVAAVAIAALIVATWFVLALVLREER